MNINQYLKRIEIEHRPSNDLASLFLLQKKHLLHVPFENLDIHHGRKIILDQQKIFQKVVMEKRGGFCYELNGLFFFLLEELGFQVKRINAQVYGRKKVFGKPYDHLAIIAKVEGEEWLVDVGFGKFSFQPLQFELDKIQSVGNDHFKIKKLNRMYHVVMIQIENGKWQYGYKFTKKHRAFNEYVPMCNWQQTSPDSHFTKRKIITIPTENEERITLTNEVLKITKGKKVTEEPIRTEKDFDKYLKKYFDITL